MRLNLSLFEQPKIVRLQQRDSLELGAGYHRPWPIEGIEAKRWVLCSSTRVAFPLIPCRSTLFLLHYVHPVRTRRPWETAWLVRTMVYVLTSGENDRARLGRHVDFHRIWSISASVDRRPTPTTRRQVVFFHWALHRLALRYL